MQNKNLKTKNVQYDFVTNVNPFYQKQPAGLTTYALTLVSVCKKPEIGETWGNQSSATGRACGNKMMTARMKIPRDHTHQLNASAIIPWSLSIIWSP